MAQGTTQGIVTKTEIKRIAGRVLDFLESQKIGSVEDLEKKVGLSLGVADKPGDVITVENRPSNENTTACTISYITSGYGIPMEARLNTKLHYTKITIKGKFQSRSYTPFSYDTFGNLVQGRELECSIDALKESLEHLTFRQKQ
ncbi:MAG: hypothetical protein AABX26_01530 [Nanoarchaeota archaeon]